MGKLGKYKHWWDTIDTNKWLMQDDDDDDVMLFIKWALVI